MSADGSNLWPSSAEMDYGDYVKDKVNCKVKGKTEDFFNLFQLIAPNWASFVMASN